MKQVVESKELGNFDHFIMKHLFGWREGEDNEIELPKAYHINVALRELDKMLDGRFERSYDFLSEFCHLNYSGVMGAYVKHDEENLWADIGTNFTKIPINTAIHPIIDNLELFEVHYNKISNFIGEFVGVCNADEYRQSL